MIKRQIRRFGQNEFIETNDKLNRLLLDKESKEQINQQKADISANFIKLGKNSHRLKIFNKGKGTARNIRIEFPEKNEIIVGNDLQEKFPVPILEQHQSVELVAFIHANSEKILLIKLIWDDDTGKDNEKESTPVVV